MQGQHVMYGSSNMNFCTSFNPVLVPALRRARCISVVTVRQRSRVSPNKCFPTSEIAGWLLTGTSWGCLRPSAAVGASRYGSITERLALTISTSFNGVVKARQMQVLQPAPLSSATALLPSTATAHNTLLRFCRQSRTDEVEGWTAVMRVVSGGDEQPMTVQLADVLGALSQALDLQKVSQLGIAYVRLGSASISARRCDCRTCSYGNSTTRSC